MSILFVRKPKHIQSKYFTQVMGRAKNSNLRRFTQSTHKDLPQAIKWSLSPLSLSVSVLVYVTTDISPPCNHVLCMCKGIISDCTQLVGTKQSLNTAGWNTQE